MIYPAELVEEVKSLSQSVKLQRPIKLYEKVFGYSPKHIGGYYDTRLVLRFIQFAELYSRIRTKCAAKKIRQLRKELRECRQKK